MKLRMIGKNFFSVVEATSARYFGTSAITEKV